MSGFNDTVNAQRTILYDISGTHDPSIQATEAAQGTTYRRVGPGGGKFFLKQDDGLTTNWLDVSGGAINVALFNALFDARFSTKSTTDLNEGLNLYFTTLRARLAVPEWIGGHAYSIDLTRAKKISLSRQTVMASWDSKTVSNRYLKMGSIPLMSDNGILIPKNSVLTGLWASSQNTDNWVAEIRLNNSATPIASLNVTNKKGKNLNLNLDVVEDDLVQIFLNGTNIINPIVFLEYAYRETI